jgi:hypothetical protein
VTHVEEVCWLSFEMRRVGGRGLRIEGAVLRDRSCSSGVQTGFVPPAAIKVIGDSLCICVG